MTPDSLIGALHLFDRFGLMLRHLTGQPLPPLPPTPGRVHQMPEITTPAEDAADLAGAAIWQSLIDGEGSGDHD
jgi:hypothetical protein